MSTTAPENLAVIAHKIGAHMFDLSTGLSEYSIRDQVVRGALFGEGLASCAAYKPGSNIMIIGAGVAGIACGARLSSHGINAHVFDVATGPFSVFSGASHRYVSPFIYEWPSVLSTQHSFLQGMGVLLPPGDKLKFPCWESTKPLLASVLAVRLNEWLKEFLESKEGRNLFIYTDANKNSLAIFAHSFASAKGNPNTSKYPFSLPKIITNYSENIRTPVSTAPTPFTVDCVVLSAGAEREQTNFFEGHTTAPFWADDSATLTDSAGKAIGVFGNGDGAFQDFLRYTFSCEHPLAIFESLPEKFKKESAAAFAELLSIEMAAKRFSIWGGSSHGLDLIQRRCTEVVQRLVAGADRDAVIKALAQNLRQGLKSVALIRSEKAAKCYLLNRFMVDLVEILQTELSKHSGITIEVKKHEGRLERGVTTAGRHEVSVPVIGKCSFDLVIVRYGGRGEEESLGRAVMGSTQATAYPARFCFENLILPYEPFPTVAATVSSIPTI